MGFDILKSKFVVLQGGMLSPILFTEFLRDIFKSFDQGQGIPVDTLLIVYLLFVFFPILLMDCKSNKLLCISMLLCGILYSAFLKQKFSFLKNAIRQNVTTATMVIT